MFLSSSSYFLNLLTSSTYCNRLIYSPGSLYTSIIPCLALPKVGSSISNSKSLKHKILLLNSKNDRETPNYTAGDFIRAIVSTLDSTELEEELVDEKEREVKDYM